MTNGPVTMDEAPQRRRVPWRWSSSLLLHIALMVVGFVIAWASPGTAGLLLGALLSGFATVQVGFLAHDLDHGHVTRHRRVRRALGLACWNFLLGVSHHWWCDKHRRHHLDTHRPGRDPDLYALFGHEPERVRALRGPHRWFVAWQAWLFWPVTLFTRAYFQALSLLHVARTGRVFELVVLVLHHGLFWGAAWFLLGTAGLVFCAVSIAVSGLYLGLSFATNHLGIPHAEERGSGTLWQAAHTRNIRCGRIGDYLLGGLNLQIEHHVYPWMPRAHLSAACAGVRAQCVAAGVPYRETGFWTAMGEVQRELSRVSRAAREPARA